MDPQAAWENLLAAYAAAEWDQVLDLAEGLLHWLKRGGFPPRATTGSELGQDWDRVVATAACQFAVDQARKEVSHAS